MAGWPRRKAQIDKSRLKGMPGSTSSFRHVLRGFHPLRRRVEMVQTRNTVERPDRNRCLSPQAVAQSSRAWTVSETIGGITHQSPETLSPSMGSRHWPGMCHTPVPPVPLLRELSGKATAGPRHLQGLMGQTEGRISRPTMQKKLFWIFAIVSPSGFLAGRRSDKRPDDQPQADRSGVAEGHRPGGLRLHPEI